MFLSRFGYLVVGIAFFAASAVAAGPSKPVAAAEVAALLGSGEQVRDVSPVFLSDDLIAILVSSGPRGPSRILVLRWTGARLQLIANAQKANEDDEIFAISDERILIASARRTYVYSPDLRERWEIPIRILSNSFPRSGTVGESNPSDWKTFRVAPALALIREGPGDLLSVSDDIVVFRLDNAIRAESAGGQLLGSIPAPLGQSDSHAAEAAGTGKLLLHSFGEERIVDFKGRELLRLRPPEGWGFRHGWSADGGRVLFDHFTRTVPLWGKLVDVVARALGAPEEDNGETIKVADTRNGGGCIAFESPGKLLGPIGSYHADLSPDGHWVAISTLAELSIFRLPDVCADR
jgi:hypothetical protein